MNSLSATLYCNAVSKSIDGKLMLDRMSLSAYPGETIALIGPNGAGKTTLLKTLAGLITPDQGSITLFGNPLDAAHRDALLPHIGTVIVTPAFERGARVRDALRKHLAFMGVENDISQPLERVGLNHLADERADALSTGNRMRLALAIALSHHPRLLLLDEPMNGLDPTGMDRLRALILDERAHGTTVIVSAHLLTELERIADHVIVIDHGRLKAQSAMSGLEDLELYYRHHTKN